MRHIVLAIILFTSQAVAGAELLIEAEGFDDLGGWALDTQFTHVMGSPYLLAHGLGRPVANARTRARFADVGTYRIWVRTKDWVPSDHPGRFQVIVDGRLLQPTFGTTSEDWTWQDGGTVQIHDLDVGIELADQTGFDGRCDALLFTTDTGSSPPNEPGPQMVAWRRKLLGYPDVPPTAGQFDLVVMGGGVAGCSAAVTAARLGLDVALIQDRPLLGGNASTEIGIHPAGLDRSIVREIVGPKRADVLKKEKRIRLFVAWQAVGVQMDGRRIASIDARQTSTGREMRFEARVFADCTGDAWVGYWAGADWRTGRESQDEFQESLAPAKADSMTHGSTIFFHVGVSDGPTSFPDVPWAVAVSGEHVDLRSDHSWEYGHRRDMIGDAEEIRDHLLCAIYGTFATVKKRFPAAAEKIELTRVGYIAARGESRRLTGAYILTENDIRSQREFPDGVARGGLVFCLHYPGEKHDFRSELKLTAVKPYLIPFRCLYSRNVDNLMMAGRNASATHVAFSSIKLMKTGGQMGVAVGAAASLCRQYSKTPRGIYESYIDELKDIVFERGEYETALTKSGNE